jgi:hypothetical protein
MLAIDLKLDGDRAWPDLLEKRVIAVEGIMKIAGLAGGLTSGKPSVTIRLDLDDGTAVLAQTSLGLFLQVADSLKARYGDPRQ